MCHLTSPPTHISVHMRVSCIHTFTTIFTPAFSPNRSSLRIRQLFNHFSPYPPPLKPHHLGDHSNKACPYAPRSPQRALTNTFLVLHRTPSPCILSLALSRVSLAPPPFPHPPTQGRRAERPDSEPAPSFPAPCFAEVDLQREVAACGQCSSWLCTYWFV